GGSPHQETCPARDRGGAHGQEEGCEEEEDWQGSGEEAVGQEAPGQGPGRPEGQECQGWRLEPDCRQDREARQCRREVRYAPPGERHVPEDRVARPESTRSTTRQGRGIWPRRRARRRRLARLGRRS